MSGERGRGQLFEKLGYKGEERMEVTGCGFLNWYLWTLPSYSVMCILCVHVVGREALSFHQLLKSL